MFIVVCNVHGNPLVRRSLSGGQDFPDLPDVLALVFEEAAQRLARCPGLFRMVGPVGGMEYGDALLADSSLSYYNVQ